MSSAGTTQQVVVVADDFRMMRRLPAGAPASHERDVAGEEAKTLARSEHPRPDAPTLDLAMPGMDGLAVLRRLRGAPGVKDAENRPAVLAARPGGRAA